MSDTHADQEGTPRVNYDEILRAAAATTIIATAFPLAGPILAIYQAVKFLQKCQPTPAENLIEIIKAGREQGLSELEVEMDKSTTVEINLGAFIDFGGVSVNPELDRKNRILLKITYK